MPENNNTHIPPAARAPKLLLLAGVLVLVALAMAALRIDVRQDAQSQAAAAAQSQSAFGNIDILAKGAIVVDLLTGEVLYQKNASTQLPLASLAKVALAIVVSDALPGDSIITIPHYVESSTGPESLSMGERWSVQDVLDFTLVTSSNGGAEALAAAADSAIRKAFPSAPVENATMWRMNELAKELDLSETFFLNVSGLDESETLSGAYGSARDVAKLFSYASENYPAVFARTAQNGIRMTSPSGAQKTILYNTNDVFGEIPGLILGKTGLTDLAGGNLAVVFDVGITHPVVAVVLGSTKDGRFSDMQELVDAARATVSGEAQNR